MFIWFFIRSDSYFRSDVVLYDGVPLQLLRPNNKEIWFECSWLILVCDHSIKKPSSCDLHHNTSGRIDKNCFIDGTKMNDGPTWKSRLPLYRQLMGYMSPGGHCKFCYSSNAFILDNKLQFTRRSRTIRLITNTWYSNKLYCFDWMIRC